MRGCAELKSSNGNTTGRLWVGVTQVRGLFFYLYLYLYLFVGSFSRKVVGWQVFDCESAATHSSRLLI